MGSFKFSELLLEESTPSFNDADKLLKYVTENDYVNLSLVDDNQPAKIKFCGYTLKLDEGGIKGVHYWNRHNMTDEIEIDVSIDKGTNLPTLKIVTDPPMDAEFWIYYDLKNKGRIVGSLGDTKKKFKDKIDKKGLDILKKYLIKWNKE